MMQVTDEMVRVAAESLMTREYGRHARLSNLPEVTQNLYLEDARAALTAALAAMWRPIEEAPKDSTWRLINDTRYPNSTVSMARWNDCSYHKKASGYWEFVDERVHGIVLSRANQPTHFMPLPSPPKAEG
jgi:hypothetical protein